MEENTSDDVIGRIENDGAGIFAPIPHNDRNEITNEINVLHCQRPYVENMDMRKPDLLMNNSEIQQSRLF